MLQFYFLSILLNITVGLILVYAKDFIKESRINGVKNIAIGQDDISDTLSDDDLNIDEAEPSPEDSQAGSSKQNIFKDGNFLDDMSFRLIVAVLAGLTGIMKLLSTTQNDVPVVGDLIPAVAGIAGSFALLLEYYAHKSTVGLNMPSMLETVFVGGRKYLGIFCIIAGVLHFIFPRVLFL